MGFCGNGCGGFDNGIIWIILLLILASCCGNGCGNNGRMGNNWGFFGGDSCSSIFILIIIFCLFCGNNTNLLNNDCDCGCGCNSCEQ